MCIQHSARLVVKLPAEKHNIQLLVLIYMYMYNVHVHVDSLTYQLVSLGNQTTNKALDVPDQLRVNVGRQLRSDRVDSLKLLLSDGIPPELLLLG